MKAAIKVGPLMFTGRTHADALNSALASEVLAFEAKKSLVKSFSERKAETGFEDSGEFITRAQAQEKYGCSTSEAMMDRGLI